MAKQTGNGTKSSDSKAVDNFMQTSTHPLTDLIAATRHLILDADARIGEEIAWNAPAFFYTGHMKPFNAKEYRRHIVVFNLFKKDAIRLVFLKGAGINDPNNLLTGNYPDGRRLIIIENIKSLQENGSAVQQIIRELTDRLVAEESL